jgi:flagellar biosynthesis protein FlhB
MPEHEKGDKTEQPTARRLQEAWEKGQFARSAELQTVALLFAALTALAVGGHETWRLLTVSMASTLGHLHDITLTPTAMQNHAVTGATWILRCVWPVLTAAVLAALVMGGSQSRFRFHLEALDFHWEKLNPLPGLQRMFSAQAVVPAVVALVKMTIILLLSYNVIRSILEDPIFYSSVDVSRIAVFLSDSAFKIALRITWALAIVAGSDYGYQWWKNHQELMMSRQELKEEAKNTDGNQQVKSRQKQRRQSMSKRKMLLEVPKADVVVTNPTHLAIALRYDRKTMRAPKIVAKGSRLNALRIRELAQQHQIPIVENKPLARLMFKHGRVGGEIPAQVYAAVAEVLAWVYRVNAYRYYREGGMN